MRIFIILSFLLFSIAAQAAEVRNLKAGQSGDLGKKVRLGVGKRVTWDTLADIPAGFEGEITWDVSSPGGAAVSGGGFTDPVTGMQFVFVKGGCYEMGDTFGDGDKDEKPVHEVCVDDFYLGKYDVTVGDFPQIRLRQRLQYRGGEGEWLRGLERKQMGI